METHTPERYRARAQQLRDEAESAEDPEHKTALLFIADNYDQLARDIEDGTISRRKK